MNRTIGLLLAAGALSLAAAWAEEETKPESSATKPVSDRELSLYPGSVFEVPNPPGFEADDDDPGENALLPRAFPIAPPRVGRNKGTNVQGHIQKYLGLLHPQEILCNHQMCGTADREKFRHSLDKTQEDCFS